MTAAEYVTTLKTAHRAIADAMSTVRRSWWVTHNSREYTVLISTDRDWLTMPHVRVEVAGHGAVLDRCPPEVMRLYADVTEAVLAWWEGRRDDLPTPPNTRSDEVTP